MKKVMEKVIFMAVGSLLTIIGYHFGSADNNSADAQLNVEPVLTDGEFDKIRCRYLEIVDADGNTRIYLRNQKIGILHENGKSGVVLAIHNGNGIVGVENSDNRGQAALLTMDEYGGAMAVFNKAGKVVLQNCVTENNAGVIKVWDKFGDEIGEIGPPGKFISPRINELKIETFEGGN